MTDSVYSILKKPLLTEKSLLLKDKQNRYAFVVEKGATKTDIRSAIEKAFKVKVKKVCTMIMDGKEHRMGRFAGRRPDWKKAIVTLEKGHKIDTAEAA